MKEVDSEQSLVFWLNDAKKGEEAVYYNGLLMMDRERYFSNGGTLDKLPQKLKAANLAWQLYTNGVVNLVQKKREQYTYDYIAIKR